MAGGGAAYRFGKPGDRGVLARNNKSAYVFAINRKAEDSKTSVCFADLEFAVKEIFNVTEDRNVKISGLGSRDCLRC